MSSMHCATSINLTFMKKKLNILFFLSLSAYLTTQAQTLQAVANLKKGDKIKLRTISYIDQNTRESMALLGLKDSDADSSVVDIFLELVEENTDNLVFSTKIQMDEQTKAMFGQFKIDNLPEQKYLIVTNKDGSSPRLKDAEAAVKAYKQQTDFLIEAMSKNPEISPMLSMLKPMIESMKEMFPAAYIRKMLLEDLVQAFIFQGEKIEKGVAGKKENVETIGISGSMFLKTKMDYRLVNYNEGKKTAIVSANYVTDKEHLIEESVEMTKRMLAKMPAAMNNEAMPSDAELKAQTQEQFSDINLNFSRTYFYDLKNGLPYMIIEKNIQKDENGKVKEIIKKRLIQVLR
jgi:hypothetical protein